MSIPTPARVRHRRRRHPLRWVTYERQFGIPLAIATLGAAVPYGAHDPYTITLQPWEWALTAVFAIAAIILIVDLIHDRAGWHLGFAAAGAAWTAYTIYHALISDSTVLDSIGQSVTTAGWAVLALAAWRALIVRDRRREARDGD